MWNGVAWVSPKVFFSQKAPKSQEPVYPPAPTLKEVELDELLDVATQRAKDLKAKRLRDAVGAKYEELTGKTLSPEEAEEMVIKAIESKEH